MPKPDVFRVCGHPKEGDNICMQNKSGGRNPYAVCRICKNRKMAEYTLRKKPACPGCKSKNATQARRGDGMRRCLDCGTRYNSHGIKANVPTPKHKGIPAGRITIGRGSNWAGSIV